MCGDSHMLACTQAAEYSLFATRHVAWKGLCYMAMKWKKSHSDVPVARKEKRICAPSLKQQIGWILEELTQ